MAMDPIEPKLEQTFESERMARMIKECTDLEDLRVIALSLLTLIGIMIAIPPGFLWTFYWPELRREMFRRNWQRQPDNAAGDARRAESLVLYESESSESEH